MYLSGSNRAITDEGIGHMMRAVQRYHFASLQDMNPIVAARHNGYAVALIAQLQELASNEEIRAASGIDASELRREILGVQDKHEGMVFKVIEKLKARGVNTDELLKGDLTKLIDRI